MKLITDVYCISVREGDIDNLRHMWRDEMREGVVLYHIAGRLDTVCLLNEHLGVHSGEVDDVRCTKQIDKYNVTIKWSVNDDVDAEEFKYKMLQYLSSKGYTTWAQYIAKVEKEMKI